MTDLGFCFLKYQQTCTAYNQVVQENRTLTASLNQERIGRMEDKIRELAYLKWEAAGYPQGNGVEFWLQAEEELTVDRLTSSVKKSTQATTKIAAKATAKRK